MTNKRNENFFVTRLRDFLLLLCVVALAGCGTAGSDSSTTPGVVDAALTLSTSLPVGTQLAQNGSTTITAYVTNSGGNPVTDGTEVLFTATGGVVSGSVLTVSGKATATYNAGSSGGNVTITATSGTLSSSLSLTVAAGSAASIALQSVTPARLGLRGTGVDVAGTFIFSVKDGAGNPVADGQEVFFKLNSTTGGGEELSINETTPALTVGGQVSVSLLSGTVPGVATVTASTHNGSATVATQARITMGYGMPDQNHISLAFEKLNVAGRVIYGLENKLTAYIADRYSNPVPADTPVYFASECGIVSLTDSAGAPTNFTNAYGIASATSITSAPADDLCRMIIWTEGEEAYTDSNGNGAYDAGEPHVGQGEPFIDANDNGTRDAGETYFDLDHNNAYTVNDNVWNGDTFVWTSGVVRWSDDTAAPVISPSTYNIATGGAQGFAITAADINGNPLPAGSTVKVTTDCTTSSLNGDTNVTIPDAVYAGAVTTSFSVTLSSTDTTPGNPKPCSLTVNVSADPNGDRTASVNGKID